MQEVKMKLKVSSVDIIVVTYHREDMLKITLEEIKKRTRFPHRVLLVNNGPEFSDEYKKDVAEKYSDIYTKSDGNIGFAQGMNLVLPQVESEYVVTTCNDIVPPDLEDPCWLERLATLIEINEDYGGINSRCQRMPNYKFEDQSKQLYRHDRTLASSFRIQRTEEMRSIGGIPFGATYESNGFARGVHKRLKKNTGCAAHIHCNHLGWDLDNKGYPEGVEYQFKRIGRGRYPQIDPKTNNPPGHACPPWPY